MLLFAAFILLMYVVTAMATQANKGDPETGSRATVQSDKRDRQVIGFGPFRTAHCRACHVSDFERLQPALRVADGLTAENMTGYTQMRDRRSSSCRLPYACV